MTMKKQSFFPKASQISSNNSVVIRTLGLDDPGVSSHRQGKEWYSHQVLRHDNFLVNVLQGYRSAEAIRYTQQEDYIKVNFWLGGKHTTILDGLGQYEHDRPEVFITAGPWEMIKVDVHGRETQMASVAICLNRSFFPTHMDLEIDQLPEPLRGVMMAEGAYAFHRFSLSPDLVGAASSILAAPPAVRRGPVYVQAKAVELMCLLINRIESVTSGASSARAPYARVETRLHEARNLLIHQYAEEITLERIAREVGLNKMALTDGFRRLFGMSVFDCLQKIRMQRAYELLQDKTNSIGRIAEAVGYRHHCNFSTAFQAHFGCTPQSVRRVDM
jgi:AraC-like DNA-binding protein